MTKLSIAATAVRDAAEKQTDLDFRYASQIAAAALRAAANEILAVQWPGQPPFGAMHQLGINWARDALHTIANELEAQ